MGKKLAKREDEEKRKREKEEEIKRRKALLKSIDKEVAEKLGNDAPHVNVKLSKGRVEILKPLMFHKSKSTLHDYSRRTVLDQVAKTLRVLQEVAHRRGLPLARFHIEGHTNCADPKKRDNKYHMKLSTDRANVVHKHLLKHHSIHEDMLTPKGFGGVRRIHEEDHEDPTMRDVKMNQRVEFNLCNADELTEGVHRSANGQLEMDV